MRLRRGCAGHFGWWVLTLAFFRNESWQGIAASLRGMLMGDSEGHRALNPSLWLLFLGLALLHIGARVLGPRIRFWRRLPAWGFAVLLGLVAAVIYAFMPLSAKPFIYFQF